MAQIRGRQTTVVHLGFVNRPSAAGNAEITGKSHEIVKLAAIRKLDAASANSSNLAKKRYFEGSSAGGEPDGHSKRNLQ
jgi:hypothetical protein